MNGSKALIGALIFTLFNAVPVFAKAPSTSIRPMPRGAAVATVLRQSLVPVFYNAKIRPRANPRRGQQTGRITDVAAALRIANWAAAPAPAPVTPKQSTPPSGLATAPPVFRSPLPRPRPMNRPTQIRQMGIIAPRAKETLVSSSTGAVCGDPGIRGVTLAPIVGKLRGCGIKAPVRVTEINGVQLSQTPVMNCTAAKSLQTWIERGVKPAVGRKGGGVKSLTTLSDYACRTRNNKKGAKISEHATGNAIDVSAINLNNGEHITVLKGWNDRQDGRMLRKMHRAACGPFGTVLGPDADRFHRDHFHLDVSNRNRPYCE